MIRTNTMLLGLSLVVTIFCFPVKSNAQIYGTYPYYNRPYYQDYYYSNSSYSYYYLPSSPYQQAQSSYPFRRKWEEAMERTRQYYSKYETIGRMNSLRSVERRDAADLLSRYSQDRDVQQVLTNSLDDPNPDVRNNAIKSLLNSENNYKLAEVIENLGALPFSDTDENALLLGRILASARDPNVRQAAAHSLGQLKNRNAVIGLRLAQTRDSNIMVQTEVARALKKIQEAKRK